MWDGVDQLVEPFSCFSTKRVFNNVPQFIYMSETAVLMSPQVLDWIKVNIHSLVWNQAFAGLLVYVFGVVVLLKHTFQGWKLSSIRQHDLFKCLTCKRIHESLYVINRLNTIESWETSPNHDASCLHWGLNSEFLGSSHKLSAAFGPKRTNFTLISPQNVPPFLLRPVDVSFLSEGRCSDSCR